jgi:hypothetical protein
VGFAWAEGELGVGVFARWRLWLVVVVGVAIFRNCVIQFGNLWEVAFVF